MLIKFFIQVLQVSLKCLEIVRWLVLKVQCLAWPGPYEVFAGAYEQVGILPDLAIFLSSRALAHIATIF